MMSKQRSPTSNSSEPASGEHEAALALAVAEAPIGIAIFDRDMRYRAVSRRFAADNGRPDEPFVGRSHYELFPNIPDHWRQIHRRVIELGEEYSHQGEPFPSDDEDAPQWIRWVMKPWRVDGSTIGGAVLFAEVINRQREERVRLHSAEQSYRSIFDLAAVGIARVAPDGRFLEVNNRFAEITGYSPAELLAGGFQQFTHPDDLAEDVAHVEELLSGQAHTFAMEKRYVGKDGAPVWVNLTVAMVRDEAGMPDYFISVIEDIGERKKAQDRERLLSREIDHRAKNLLMVVQSIVHLSGGPDINHFKESVFGRIQALARAHSVLAASRWNAVALRSLVQEELEPYAMEGCRVTCGGPDVNLKPAAAQSLALVIHELATNAAKYGALSVPQGRVAVHWQLEDERMAIDWRESDGPSVTPPSTSGFGSALIRITIERQLKGQLKYDWVPEGLQCQFAVDRAMVVVDQSSAAEGEPQSRH
jgi:PAS domain S-box-containing protein